MKQTPKTIPYDRGNVMWEYNGYKMAIKRGDEIEHPDNITELYIKNFPEKKFIAITGESVEFFDENGKGKNAEIVLQEPEDFPEKEKYYCIDVDTDRVSVQTYGRSAAAQGSSLTVRVVYKGKKVISVDNKIMM